MDLIERQKAIDALWEIRQEEISDGRRFHDHCSLSTAVDVIKDLPSAQPEPCEDAISRQTAIDTEGLEEEIRCEMCRNQMKTNRGCDGNCKYDEKLYEKITQILDKRITPLLSAQPESNWIPISERLPKKFGNYLISIHGEDEPDIGTISPNDKRGWSLCDAKGFHWASDQKLIVTAWMPLPEPYQKGEQDG